MEAVRKKSRRSHGRKKARSAQLHDGVAPRAAAEDARSGEDVAEEEDRADPDIEVVDGGLDALSALEAATDTLVDASSAEKEQTNAATLDQEIAENEEALLAILGEGFAEAADDVLELNPVADRAQGVGELLVAEASGSFPSNHENDHGSPLQQPTGFAADGFRERGGDAVGVATAPPFPDSPLGEATQEPAVTEHTPSAPDFDMSDEHDMTRSTFEPSSMEATNDIATPSAPPLFPDMNEESVSHLAIPDALNVSPATETLQAAVSESADAPTNTNTIQHPEAQTTVLPARPSAPHAFHSVPVESTSEEEGPMVSGAFVPSAPLELEIDEDYAAYREAPLVSSAPSLSPTLSKQLRHVVNVEDPAKLQSVTRSRPLVVADTSVESASVAVRASLAKSKVSEAHRTGIYPTVPARSKEVAPASTSVRSDKVDDRRTYESLLKKQHIRINLEPFVNFEMNLLRAEASQKRQEMKMRHIETNKGELYGRLERYLFSEYILHTAASSLEASKKEIDALVKKGGLIDAWDVILCPWD
jgi:hypothetical protein